MPPEPEATPSPGLLARLRARLAPQMAGLEALREHEALRLLLAGVVVGALGALAAVVFDHGMSLVGELVLGTAFPARDPPPWWRALLGPAAMGVLVGLLVQHLTKHGRPQGMTDVLARVQLDQPSLSLRDGGVSALAAALAVGGGFSGGREGPIIQFSSALASTACRLLRVRPARVRTLVAAGAAAGIAASFNTPLGGAFFALEIILGNFAVESFVPVVAATVTGTVLGQALLGERIALRLPAFAFESPWELPLYLVLGGVGALVAHAFKRAVIDGSARLAAISGPTWLRPVVMGGVVGIVAATGFPEVMGNGYGYMEDLLRGRPVALPFLATLLLAKVFATSFTVAGRTGAGLFAPSLFVGCITGAIFGSGAHALWPDHTEAVGAYGMVGMGSVAAAVLGAPITMTLMLFEMTGNYQVILPLMLALVASGIVSVALGSRSLEAMELDREGLSLAKGREAAAMQELRVGDIHQVDGIETVPVDAPLSEVVGRFLRRRIEEVYVVDAEGRYRGAIHIQDVKPALADPARAGAVRPRAVATVQVDERVADVLPRFFDAPGDALPVVDGEGHLLGIIAERDVMAAYHREVIRKDARLARIVNPDEEGSRDDYLELPVGQAMEAVAVGPARAGRTLRDLALPRSHHCTVVAMSLWEEALGDWQRQPVDADRILRAEDRLILIGPPADLARLSAEGAAAEGGAIGGAPGEGRLSEPS